MDKKGRRARARLSPEEKRRQLDHKQFRNAIRDMFETAGFTRFPVLGKEIRVEGQTSELDELFLYDNLAVAVEETTAEKQRDIVEHLRKKHEFATHVLRHPDALTQSLEDVCQPLAAHLKHSRIDRADIIWKFVYIPRHTLDREYQSRYSEIRFVNFHHLMYFSALSRTIRASARYELFRFLGITQAQLGVRPPGQQSATYQAVLLSEQPSGFGKGHKVVSFLVDPQSLLERAYVLRTSGWEDRGSLYQRLLLPAKIRDMRRYLAKTNRAFVNNLIVTLPSDTRFVDPNGQELEDPKSNARSVVSVQLPDSWGSIGIVDGQHRLFCYHEGKDQYEPAIAALRKRQHLLVTGIRYPPGFSESSKTKFEAKLFLEINDKQNRVRSDLRQEIQVLVDPLSPVAIAKAVVSELAAKGPLAGELEQHYYDRGKIKTASIVSYGLRHVVNPDVEHSLWRRWAKDNALHELTPERRQDYVAHCAGKVSDMFYGFKQAVEAMGMWDRDQKKSRALTITTINGVIFCLRMLVSEGRLPTREGYMQAFTKLGLNFSPQGFTYKSSNWKSLGEEIHRQCFKD